MACRGTAVTVGMTGNEGIELLAVGRRDILDIADILQPPFYLERGSTCRHQFLQMLTLVEVLQRQQMTLMLQFATIGIDEVELHPTELRTGPSVG